MQIFPAHLVALATSLLSLTTKRFSATSPSTSGALISSTAAASSTSQQQIRMASQKTQQEVEGLNVLGAPLEQHGTDPITGFFRDGYCRPSPMDPAEHTLAGVLTKEFLEFSKERGNDLMTPRGGFPGLKEGCRWCLCVSRWKEAYLARSSHPSGDRIVPFVNLKGTSMTALGEDQRRRVTLEELKEFEERKMA